MSLKVFDFQSRVRPAQTRATMRPERKVQTAHTPLPPTVVQRAAADGRSLTVREMIQLQRAVGQHAMRRMVQPAGRRRNATGLPDNLKAGVEALAGVALDDVRVHYHSAAPADVQALAYAQGADIHLGPGQEQHLPHEAWHVAQQKQGRVTPTLTVATQPMNDDPALEQEASARGAQAARWSTDAPAASAPVAASVPVAAAAPIQAIIDSAQFRALTPGTVLRWRRTVDAIDGLLDTYHGSDQAHKLAAMDALMAELDRYLTSKLVKDPGNVRIAPVRDLLHAASIERVQVLRLDRLAQHGTAADLHTIGQVAALSLAELTAIAQVAQAPAVTELAALLNDIGNGPTLLALLQSAVAAGGAGTPWLRLRRVLDANPGTPRTHAALLPLLTAQLQIDEKILRGRIGAPLAAGQIPTGDQRDVIGGHSPAMRNDPAYMFEASVLNPNATTYVGFRKLLRADLAGFATAVANHAPGNIVTAVQLAVQAAVAAVTPTPAFPANFLARAPQAVQQQRQAAQAAALAALQNAQPLVAGHVATCTATAPAAAAHAASAASVKPFLDAADNLLASADAVITAAAQVAANTVNPNAVLVAQGQLQALQTAFAQQGPVLSIKKNSTLAPTGWSDDAILRAGDETAAVPATLLRHRVTNNTPPDNAQVETKHQKLIQGMVWVVMKANVLYHTAPPRLTGGEVTSSYPTSATVIPADPVRPAADGDGFSALP